MPSGINTINVPITADVEVAINNLRRNFAPTAGLSSIFETLIGRLTAVPAGAIQHAVNERLRNQVPRSGRGIRKQVAYVGLRREVYAVLAARARQEDVRIADAMIALVLLQSAPDPTSEVEQLRRELAMYRARFGAYSSVTVGI